MFSCLFSCYSFYVYVYFVAVVVDVPNADVVPFAVVVVVAVIFVVVARYTLGPCATVSKVCLIQVNHGVTHL